jgi:hypothetical protein
MVFWASTAAWKPAMASKVNSILFINRWFERDTPKQAKKLQAAILFSPNFAAGTYGIDIL